MIPQPGVKILGRAKIQQGLAESSELGAVEGADLLQMRRRQHTAAPGEQAQNQFEPAFLSSFLSTFALSLLVRQCLFHIGDGQVQHGADLLAGQLREFIHQNRLDQIQGFQRIGRALAFRRQCARLD